MKKTFCFVLTVLLFSACSLKYDENVSVNERIPEFIFKDANLVRYENKERTVELFAEEIEKYENSANNYAKNVDFKAYNDKQELTTEGFCNYIYLNLDSELYELYGNITLYAKDQNTYFYADILRWNAKNEQLTSGRSDFVKIRKDDTVIYGSGFSASGVSRTYSFTGAVTGDIETK